MLDLYIRQIRKEIDEGKPITQYKIPEELINDIQSAIENVGIEENEREIKCVETIPVGIKGAAEGCATFSIIIAKSAPAYWVRYEIRSVMTSNWDWERDTSFCWETCFIDSFQGREKQIDDIMERYGYCKLSWKEISEYDLQALATLYSDQEENRYIRYPLEQVDVDKGIGIMVSRELGNVAKEVLDYAAHVHVSGRDVRIDGMKEVNHTTLLEKMDNYVKRRGGARLQDTPLTYSWRLGTGRICTGRITICTTIEIYLSRYLNIAYVKSNRMSLLRRFEDKDIKIFDGRFNAKDMSNIGIYETLDDWRKNFSEVAWLAFTDIRHKLPVMQDVARRDIHIGRMLFGFTKKDCSEIGKMKIKDWKLWRKIWIEN